MIKYLIPLYIAIIVFVILLPTVIYINMTSQSNPCIQDKPWVVVAGHIQPPVQAIFTSTPQVYYLYYKGKFKLTGEECRIRRCVTEKEYERRIYKRGLSNGN